MTDRRKQIVTGLVPPQLDEAIIREVRRSLAASAVAGLAPRLMKTIVLAPLGWLVLLLPFLGKILLPRRYTLTNRRLMIRRGLKPAVKHAVALSEIDAVRLQPESYSDFYRAGTLEVSSDGKVVLTLPATPGPEAFRQAILNACTAWAPGKLKGPAPPSAAETAKSS
jgi:hypothetical protein